MKIGGQESERETAQLNIAKQSETKQSNKISKMPYLNPSIGSKGSPDKKKSEEDPLQLTQQISFSNNSTMGPKVNALGSIQSPGSIGKRITSNFAEVFT